jgi:Ca-activated chloride channel family protein
MLVVPMLTYSSSYDSAIYKAQKGNWQDAHVALNNIITHNPDKADVVYDAGVAAYNLGNKCQAATCFARAAERSTDKNIAFRAHFTHFNAGNTYVDEKDLKSALKEYDKALAIEPDNEYARHNRDRVAEMLKEEEKQQEQQNKDDEKKDDQDKQKNQDQQNQNGDGQQNQDKQNNQDQQQQNGDDQKSENGNDKKDGQQNQKGNDQKQKSDSSHDESSNDQSQGDSQQRDAADGKDTQRQEHGNKKEQQQNSANDQKRDGKNELDKQSQGTQGERDKKQGDEHGTAPEKQQESNDKSSVSSEGDQEQVINDPWLLNVLNNQEMHDKAINKQLMEAKIRQHGGKNGQNCW